MADLGGASAALGIDGPVVTVAHDWGGPISLGWALAHREQLRGIVLLNTAVHQPEGSPSPSIIRLARSSPLLRLNTVQTPIFVRGTSALSGRSMPRDVAAAFAAPYATPDRRAAVGAFVADIPFEPGHPSAQVLDAIAEGIRTLDVPVLLLWGPGDPVFSDRYLNDLSRPDAAGRCAPVRGRAPPGQRGRPEPDRGPGGTWVADLESPRTGAFEGQRASPTSTVPRREPLWAALAARAAADPAGAALAEPAADGGWRTVSWALLHRNVELLARGLAAEASAAGTASRC